MLDLKIPHLRKVIQTARQLDAFVRSPITVEEKFDGTKLTLIRNSSPFDPTDYTKNWIVAYKGSIISPEEISGVRAVSFGTLTSESVGMSQYALVHAHLQSVHAGTETVPLNTELLVEFIQNKPTVLRDYTFKHGLFLIGYATIRYVVDSTGMRVYSNPTIPLQSDPLVISAFCHTLKLLPPKVVCAGTLASLKACPSAPEKFTSVQAVGFHQKLETFLLSFESLLGGKPEGVVIREQGGQGRVMKLVNRDQCDHSARSQKKQRFVENDPELEKAYWTSVHQIATRLVTQFSSIIRGRSEMLEAFSRTIYDKSFFVAGHSKKTLLNCSDDLMLTCKLLLERKLKLHGSESLGVIVMAGKPVHQGHWHLIKRARAENDVVHIYVSTRDRQGVSWSSAFEIWREFLLPKLPSNVFVTFSDSPSIEARRELEKPLVPMTVYTALTPDKGWWPSCCSVTVVNRKDTGEISGTKMRAMLLAGDESEFKKNLPCDLDDSAKRRIWEILRE